MASCPYNDEGVFKMQGIPFPDNIGPRFPASGHWYHSPLQNNHRRSTCLLTNGSNGIDMRLQQVFILAVLFIINMVKIRSLPQ